MHAGERPGGCTSLFISRIPNCVMRLGTLTLPLRTSTLTLPLPAQHLKTHAKRAQAASLLSNSAAHSSADLVSTHSLRCTAHQHVRSACLQAARHHCHGGISHPHPQRGQGFSQKDRSACESTERKCSAGSDTGQLCHVLTEPDWQLRVPCPNVWPCGTTLGPDNASLQLQYGELLLHAQATCIGFCCPGCLCAGLDTKFDNIQLIPAANGYDAHSAQKDTCHLPNIKASQASVDCNQYGVDRGWQCARLP